MIDKTLRLSLLVVDLSPVIKQIGRYENILPILKDVPLSEIIEALLAVSVNGVPGKPATPTPGYLLAMRNDNELIWYVLEKALGERFETIPVNDLGIDLDSLLCELDDRIGRALPTGWCPGEYTFFNWLGPGQIVVMKDR